MLLVRDNMRWVTLVALVSALGCLATNPEPNIGGIPADQVQFSSVDAGASHACALGSLGAAYCWGDNGAGQLGLGDVENRYEPFQVMQGDLIFTEVSAGAAHTCAMTDAREVYCWGSDQFGQLGTSSVAGIESNPVHVLSPVEFVTVSVGGAHTCGLTASGAAYCWGLAGAGQLGTGVTGDTPRPSPDPVLGGLSFQQLSAGNDHTCAVTPGGEAYCWGAGTFGELGNGANGSSAEPVAVSGGLLFQSISAGDEHTCAVTLDGDAYCWGSGGDGRLGNGGVSNSNVPVLVDGGLFFSAISAGGGHTCGVTGTQEAYCWGRNDQGQLGDGTNVSRLEPVKVAGGVEFETVSAGIGQVTTATCGLGSDGLVYCWGDGLSGQLGNGSTASASVPTLVSGQQQGPS